MHIHYLQHVSFEGPAAILDWARLNQHDVSATRLFDRSDKLPAMTDFDMLVVMGGPMAVYDSERYPWLAVETEFIRQCISENKLVLGICLGAQLIASALGAEIRKNRHREIGWFPLTIDPALQTTRFSEVFTDNMLAYHWHGDSFELPENAIRIASSQACKNQGFIIHDRIIGLQFHLETTAESAALLIDNCSDDLDNSRYVQSKDEMLNFPAKFDTTNDTLVRLLSTLENR